MRVRVLVRVLVLVLAFLRGLSLLVAKMISAERIGLSVVPSNGFEFLIDTLLGTAMIRGDIQKYEMI